MDWSAEAKKELSRVPFFVRSRVRARVEEEAAASGASVVEPLHLELSKGKFLSRLSSEVRGYRVEQCFGPSRCPNRAADSAPLAGEIESLLLEKDVLGFLQRSLGREKVKPHHEFRVSISECPNACSRPQIFDLGIIGAAVPEAGNAECTRCGACEEICREHAISLDGGGVLICAEKCLQCGQCIDVCPTGKIFAAGHGFRIQIGGRLGRHPHLARELSGLYSQGDVLWVLERCVDLFLSQDRGGVKRFAYVLDGYGADRFIHELESSLKGSRSYLTAI
ncbi:MAG: 4Fe-4S dicluster domain-containing protein [Desulfonatronovibrionaceae bacterium]